MEFETISVLIPAKKIKIVTEIVTALSDKIPGLGVTPFKYGRIGDEILVSFKIDKKFYQLVIEKFTFNSIKVVTFDEKTKQYVEDAKSHVKSFGTGGFMLRRDKPKVKEEEKKTLAQLISEGDYLEVIKISKDVTLPKDDIEFAKQNIDFTINKAITSAYTEGHLKKIDVQKNLEKLVKIASDNSLKLMQKYDIIKQAGFYAIEISSQSRDNFSYLIDLCNNNALHNLICAKAAICFYDIAFVDKDMYRDEIINARRKLNVRWLAIALSVVATELTPQEKDSINALIEFISAKRL